MNNITNEPPGHNEPSHRGDAGVCLRPLGGGSIDRPHLACSRGTSDLRTDVTTSDLSPAGCMGPGVHGDARPLPHSFGSGSDSVPAAKTPALYHGGQNDKDATPVLKLHQTSAEFGEDDHIGVDWLTMTFPESVVGRIARKVRAIEAGPAKEGRAQHAYARQSRFPSGLTLSTGHRSGRAMLNVPGSACASLGTMDVLKLARRVYRLSGGDARATRCDWRRDTVRADQTFISEVIAACKRGELRRVQRFKEFIDRRGDSQLLMGHGVYLGSTRSQRFVRVYDKGLETTLCSPGTWVRFEAQFRDEFADGAMRAVVDARSSWHLAAFQYIAGVVDFVPGERGPGVHWDRLPRSPFWSAYLAGASTLRTRKAVRSPDVVSHADWLYRSLGQLQAAADLAGITLGQAVDRLLGSARPNPDGALVHDLKTALDDRSTSLVTLGHVQGQEEAVHDRRHQADQSAASARSA